MLFVTILVDFTLARVNVDIQETGKTALVSYNCLTSTIKFIDWKKKWKEATLKIRYLPTALHEFFCLFLISAIFKLDFSVIRKILPVKPPWRN